VPRSDALSVWFPAPGAVELRREHVGRPGPGQVQVRAVASGISQGTELLVHRGQVPPDLELDLPTLRGSFGFPIKYGYASVGEVVAAGPDTPRPAVGDLVFVHHPHQSCYVVDSASAVPLPAGTDPERAVFLANLETAVNVLLDAHPHLGDRMLVFGQGVVGLLIAQLARRAGAGLVITADPLGTRREASLEVGADASIDPRDREGMRVLLERATLGRGIDIAIEASGHPDALDPAIECLGQQGTLVVCSWYGTKPVLAHLGGSFHRRRLRLVSSQVSNVDPALSPRWDRERRMRVAVDLLPELRLRRLISHRFPLEEADTAYRLLAGGRDDVLQVVLTYAGAARRPE
jgi:2-desacetyl-2-hydroxyethyl bacteriochlorophyllide A dehydrogenase